MPIKPCRFCSALRTLKGAEQVAELKDGVLFIGGIKPTIPQLEELGREVQILSQTSLWKLLTDTIRSQAVQMGIRDAKDFDQLMFAKAMLHIVGVQERLVALITKEYNLIKEVKDLEATRLKKG